MPLHLSRLFAWLLLGVAVMFAVAGAAHAQTTLTWTGAGSNANWSNVNNWDGTNYPNNGQPTPGATYNAIVNTGNPTLDTNVTINNLTYATSGVLTGSGSSTLTVNGLFAWSNGSFTLNQMMLVGGASITGASEAFATTITNASGSTATFSNEGGNLYANNSAGVWVNQSAATFTFSADANLTGASGQFTNDSGATFQKTGGSTTSEVNWSFSNSGIVNAASGTLRFYVLPNLVSGTLNAGTWNVAAGATLTFAPGNVTSIGPGAAVSLTGVNSTFAALDSHLTTNGGSLSILGGRSFTPASTLANSGTLIVGQSAGDGSQFTGSVTTSTGGTLRGTGTVTGTATQGSGSTLAPGTTTIPGTLAAGTWVFQPNGSYLFKYNPATTTPVAGTDNDRITASAGTLNLSGLSSNNQFTIYLQPASAATPENTSVTFIAGSFLNVIGSGGSNVTPLFAFAGVYSGTPTANLVLNGSQDQLQITFIPGVAVPPGSFNWTGSASGNWSTGANWNPSNVPSSSPNNQFTFGATTHAAMINDIAGFFVVGSLNFSAASPVYTLSGNSLLFQANSNPAWPQIVTNSANSVTISNAIALNGILTVSGSGQITMSGAISGSGGLTYSGTGMLTLSGSNNYSGGTIINSGTLGITSDASLAAGVLTFSAFGTLEYTVTTTTANFYSLSGGNLAVASGQTLTLNGSQISGGYLSGPGMFATNVANGARFGNMTIQPSATVNSNCGADFYFDVSNGGTLNVAANIPVATPVVLRGFTNQGSGSITIGAASPLSVSDFQSYGTLTINPATVTENYSQTTLLTNTGTSQIYFNGGSRTFIGTPATALFPPTWPDSNLRGTPTFVAGIDLHGHNAVVAGGQFVNNGYVVDYSNGGAGTATIVADYGALIKGSGFYQNPVITQNGGRLQAGNSPGVASFGRLVFGPGGVSNYVFAIDDATGQAGPSPDAAGHVSGWGLIKSIQRSVGSITTNGDFTWTATPNTRLTVAIDTLMNPTMVGTDVAGMMADFDPMRAYSWSAANWAGTYSGPTDAATLNAATNFDTSGFLNPIAGTFGWSLDPVGQTLSLNYTPTSVPEPGTMALLAVAASGLAALTRCRNGQPQGRKSSDSR
jgi:autotransporter-associated beta strand protein